MTEIQKQITNLVNRGMFRAQICEITKLTFAELNTKLREYGLFDDQIESEAMLRKIDELEKKGMSVENIALEMGISPFYLKHKMNNRTHSPKVEEKVEEELQVKPKIKMKPPHTPYSEEEKEQIKTLIKKKVSTKTIGKRLGRTTFSINNAIKRYGLSEKKLVPWTLEEDKIMNEMCLQGKTPKEISEILKRTEKAIQVRISNSKTLCKNLDEIKIVKAGESCKKPDPQMPVYATIVPDADESKTIKGYPEKKWETIYAPKLDDIQYVGRLPRTEEDVDIVEVVKQLVQSNRKAIILL